MIPPQQVTQETLESTHLPNSLTYLLRVSSGNAALEHWQSGLIAAIESFLVQLKAVINQQAITLSPVMISYALDKNSPIDIEVAAKLLGYSFNQVGVPVTLCSLSEIKTLELQLKQHTYAIVLCTPQYAKDVEKNPAIRQALDAFGHTKKNALQPLLCEGGFGDTALKIVDSHYLIRSYQAVIKKQPLTAFPYFVDILLNMSGSQGLGILPDILDLKETYNNQIELAYRAAFDQLQFRQQQLTIDYRLNTSLIESAENHPMKTYLEPAAFPVIKKVPGFKPIIQELFNTSAKVGLLFCATKADTDLTSLALTQGLITQSRRVLSIECADYPGKAAADCVRLSLQKMKLKTTDIEAIKKEPLLILLKGYENIGAYDNLWVKNKLSTWANVKLLVTCRADFFKFRGYLNCFLADVSNRQVDDLLVYKVPTFASNVAREASLSLTHTPQTANVAETTRLNPRRNAEQIELTVFLKKLNELWVKEGHLKPSLQQNPQIFISYAWEEDKTALARQQEHLSRISQDLTTLGFSAWLDIERMSGDIDEQMAGNIANSQGVLVIETPRYTARSEQNTNVKKEFDAILQKIQQDPDFKLFPLRFLPGLIPSALENHSHQCDFTGIDEDYVARMADPNIGLIPKLLLDNPAKRGLYGTLYTHFQEQLQLLVAKHLVVNQGQEDIQAYDIDNRLKGYIIPYGLYSEASPLDKRFDLNKYFQAFLDNTNTRTAVVLGQAGSGKSLFALSSFKVFLQTWHQYRNREGSLPTWLPVYIQLRNHAKHPENCIENSLLQFLSPQDIQALKQGLGHNQRILFILDGYDELGSGIRPNLSESLRDWPLAKLLITGRPQHFDKDHPPLETLSLLSPDGRVVSNSTQVVYVSPFSADEVKRYVDFYALSRQQDANKAIYGNAYKTLQKLPGMMLFLDNPFLLTLVLQALPQLLKNQGTPRSVTKADIYQAFTQTWFLQETQGLDLDPKDCKVFSQELAFQLFQAKTISVADIPEKKELWAFFTNDVTQAAQAASPLRFNDGQYSFVHKSLYEYFTATRLWKAVFESNCLTFWQTRPLTEEQPIIDFLSELYQISPSQDKEARLMKLIEDSRNPDFSTIASSNAMTVLNAAKVAFSGKNLVNIRIPGANLMGAILDNTNLENADLSHVTLSGAWLHGTNFKNALLTNVSLNEYPSFLLENSVSSCSYSPDGKILAVTVQDNINLYDSKTRALLKTLEGHTSSVCSVCFSADGMLLASGSNDNTLKLWSVESGELQKTMKGHTDTIYSVQFSPDGKRLASGSSDYTVKLWNVEDGELQKTLKGHTDTIYSVHFSPNNKLLASGSGDYSIKLWGIEGGELQKTLCEHTDTIYSVYFSPDGNLLASGSNDETVKLWIVESGELQKTLKGHSGTVSSVHFSPDGKLLASGSGNLFGTGGDKTVKLWSVASGELQKTLEGHCGEISSVQFSPDGKMLVSGGGSYDNTVKLWSVDGKEPKKTEGHNSRVSSVSFSSDGKLLASASSDGTVRLWKTESGELQKTLEAHTREVTSVHFSPDGKWLASGGDDKTVRLWSVENGELQKTLEGHPGSVTTVHFSPDSKLLASGGGYRDETVKLWHVESGELQQTLADHTKNIFSIHFSPDGKRLASGSWDATVKLWRVEDGELQNTLEGHESGVTSVHFSPDGKWLVSGSWDATVKLWRVEDGGLQKTEKHTGEVLSVQFSPDGKLLASSENNTVRVWQGINMKEEFCITNKLSSTAKTLSFNQNEQGTFLATGHDNGTVCYWKLQTIDKKPYLQLIWSSFQNALLCQDANLEGVRDLSVNNADLLKQKGALGQPFITKKDHPGWSPLHLAVANDNHEEMSQLIQKKTIDYPLLMTNEDDVYPEQTPLHLAAESGDKQAVIELIKQWQAAKLELDLNAVNHQGRTPLFLAVESSVLENINEGSSDGEIIKILLENGADVHSKDGAGNIAAHHAALSGQLEILNLLRDRGADLLNEDENFINSHGYNPFYNIVFGFNRYDGSDGYGSQARSQSLIWFLKQDIAIEIETKNGEGETVVHVAARHDLIEALKLLKERGANLLVTDNKENTPFHVAVLENKLKAVEWFLEQEIPIELTNDEGATVVHIAAQKGYVEILALLKKRGTDLLSESKGFVTLHIAAHNNQTEVIEWLLKQGIPVNTKDDEGLTLVHIAAFTNQIEMLELLKEQGADLLTKDNDNYTALDYAILGNKVAAAEWFLDQGIPIELKNDEGETAVHIAARKGNLEILQLLKKRGADLLSKANNGYTPFHIAAIENKAEIIEWFLQQGVSIELKSNTEDTAAHIVAKIGQVEILKLLKKRGADLLAKNNNGFTPLHSAAFTRQVEVVRWLLEQKISTELKNNTDETAAYIAARRGDIQILKLLKEKGANLLAKNNKGYTPLHTAVFHNQGKIIEWLLDEGISVELKDNEGCTAAHVAAYRGYVDILQLLKERAADLLAKDTISPGGTPLHRAAASNQVQVIEWLLNEGIFIDILRDDGSTPLHRAAVNGSKEAVELLLQRNANPYALNKDGKTPAQLAQENDKKDSVACIERFITTYSINDKMNSDLPKSLSKDNEVLEATSQMSQKANTISSDALVLLSSPAQIATNRTNTELGASFEQLRNIYIYLVEKSSLKKPGFEPRLQHFSQLLVDITQATPNLRTHLQTATVFKHHSMFKRDRYHDMIRKLIENDEGNLMTLTQNFITYLAQCRDGQGQDPDRISVAKAILTGLDAKEIKADTDTTIKIGSPSKGH